MAVGGPCYVQSPIQVTGFLCAYKTTARNAPQGYPSVKFCYAYIALNDIFAC